MSQGSLIPESSTVPSFPPLAYKGVPVLTTEMLAQAYEVAEHQIRQNFKNNRSLKGNTSFPYQVKNSRILLCT